MISVRDLRFTYPGAGRETLRGLSFEVEPGEIFGFLGPSGAGKSTTQRVLTGVLRGYTGAVRVRGVDPRASGRDFYERIGVSFELPNLYSKLTALENLTFFAGLYNGPTVAPRALLERVGLADAAGVRAGELSKGMKMRVNLCRALLNDPDLVFLDEPTAGVDPAIARDIRGLVAELKHRGKTVFLTTHNMAEATELCDRVAFIVEGRLPLIDVPRELMLRHGRPWVRVEYTHGGSVGTREFRLAGLGADAAFQALLAEHDVRSIHTQEATLEDVFIETTGRTLT